MDYKIIYKNKKNSSAVIRDKKMILYISKNLPEEIQEKHIRLLKEKLTKRYYSIQQRKNKNYRPSTIDNNKLLYNLVKKINDTYYGFEYNNVIFKRQFSRWGSCSLKTRNIYISHRLKNAPMELLGYVIVHELCHLQYPNHGKQFWGLVEKACPYWKKYRQDLELIDYLEKSL